MEYTALIMRLSVLVARSDVLGARSSGEILGAGCSSGYSMKRHPRQEYKSGCPINPASGEARGAAGEAEISSRTGR